MFPFTVIHIAVTFISGDTEVCKVLLTRQKKVWRFVSYFDVEIVGLGAWNGVCVCILVWQTLLVEDFLWEYCYFQCILCLSGIFEYFDIWKQDTCVDAFIRHLFQRNRNEAFLTEKCTVMIKACSDLEGSGKVWLPVSLMLQWDPSIRPPEEWNESCCRIGMVLRDF